MARIVVAVLLVLIALGFWHETLLPALVRDGPLYLLVLAAIAAVGLNYFGIFDRLKQKRR